ncbi:LOW QUALITY PROTEIN: hypothetical protein V2J09_016991 [Rumex salicifolius]
MIDLILLWCKNDFLFADIWSMIVPDLNIISWNAQGAGSRSFLNSLKDLIRTHDSAIVADKVCEVIDFDGILRSEAMGFRGGYMDTIERRLCLNYGSGSAATIYFAQRSGEAAWLFSAIYACPNSASRETLWAKLLEFSVKNKLTWLLMGDFNKTKSLEERTGSLDALRRRCERFNHWIEDIGLLDIGFTGKRSTWNRGKDLTTRTCARLEMGLCNSE